MSIDSVEVIKYLHEFFPERAASLMFYLEQRNAEEKKLEEWRINQIGKLMMSLTINTVEMERAFSESRVSTLACTARNLLQISVWIDYCNLSITHADSFRKDAARDGLGLTKAIQAMYVEKSGAEHVGLKEAQDRLANFAASVMGIPALDDNFERVLKAAEEVGRGKEFSSKNKMFSKLAHPTAWAINSVNSIEADAEFRGMFLEDGVTTATSSLTRLREFIIGQYPTDRLETTWPV